MKSVTVTGNTHLLIYLFVFVHKTYKSSQLHGHLLGLSELVDGPERPLRKPLETSEV